MQAELKLSKKAWIEVGPELRRGAVSISQGRDRSDPDSDPMQIGDRSTEQPVTIASRHDEFRRLDYLLDRLEDQEARVLRLRYGIGTGGDELTLDEIGRVLGCTKEWVRQIERKAMENVRSLLSSLAA